jgi:hypothetical protein
MLPLVNVPFVVDLTYIYNVGEEVKEICLVEWFPSALTAFLSPRSILIYELFKEREDREKIERNREKSSKYRPDRFFISNI